MKVWTYDDKKGIPRKVILPDLDFDPDEGIPYSLNIDHLYDHMPKQFLIDLYQALWAVGLVCKQDYSALDAPERARAAMLSVVKHDAFDIITVARGQGTHHA